MHKEKEEPKTGKIDQTFQFIRKSSEKLFYVHQSFGRISDLAIREETGSVKLGLSSNNKKLFLMKRLNKNILAVYQFHCKKEFSAVVHITFI